jgi:hypothetical protein
MPLRQREKIQELLRSSCVSCSVRSSWSVIPSEPEESLADFCGGAGASKFEDITRSYSHAALVHLVGRNLQLVAVGVAEIDRVRDLVI